MQRAHLRDFIAVADTGSVRAAARRLRLSQGAISKNLLALERELGVALLVRSARGVEPTEYGRILLRRARLADLELRRAQEEIAALAGHDVGTLNIGLSSTAEALLAARVVARYREAYPDGAVHIHGGTAATLVSLLREGKVDLAVTPLPESAMGTDLAAERLFSADFVIVAREGHPRAQATQLAELVDCEWIHGARPGELAPLIATTFRKLGLAPPRLVARRDSFSALLFLLLESDYIAVATEPSVAPFCRPGLLARIPVPPPGTSVQSLVVSASRPLTPRAQYLAAEIRRASRAHRR